MVGTNDLRIQPVNSLSITNKDGTANMLNLDTTVKGAEVFTVNHGGNSVLTVATAKQNSPFG